MVIVLTCPVTVMTDVTGVGVHVDFGDVSSDDDEAGTEEVVGAGAGAFVVVSVTDMGT